MALSKVKTKAAGAAHKARWATRAEVKEGARKRRRREGKVEVTPFKLMSWERMMSE